jgi:DNA transposition AAA+ family ATPase
MSTENSDFHAAHVGTIARLRNVTLFHEGLTAALARAPHLPGLVVFHGPSGYGKTFAATLSANLHRAHYVEARSSWTKRALCRAILHEMGIEPAQRVYEMSSQIADELRASGRPLILDEADHVLAAGAIEIVRDIHESSGAAIALIGEERLPAKLRAVERVHNRVLRWVAAMPVDLHDTRELSRLYCAGLTLADDLLQAVVDAAKGGARRVCINLDLIRDAACTEQPAAIDAAWWAGRPLYTGQVQPRDDAWSAAKRGAR